MVCIRTADLQPSLGNPQVVVGETSWEAYLEHPTSENAALVQKAEYTDTTSFSEYLYYDGSLVPQSGVRYLQYDYSGNDNQLATSSEPLIIGAMSPPERYRAWNGLLDDIHIYSRMLSAGEIAYLAKPLVDLNDDGVIDFKDFAILASQYLDESVWPTP